MKREDFDGSAEVADNRDSSGRDSESRDFYKRNIIRMYSTNPFHIPPELMPDGVDYLWVRYSMFGEEDLQNQSTTSSKGWMPVPASRHPELSTADFFGRSTHPKGYIFNRGNILCERPSELGQVERELMNKQVRRAMLTPALSSSLSDPSMPISDKSHVGILKTVSLPSYQ